LLHNSPGSDYLDGEPQEVVAPPENHVQQQDPSEYKSVNVVYDETHSEEHAPSFSSSTDVKQDSAPHPPSPPTFEEEPVEEAPKTYASVVGKHITHAIFCNWYSYFSLFLIDCNDISCVQKRRPQWGLQSHNSLNSRLSRCRVSQCTKNLIWTTTGLLASLTMKVSSFVPVSLLLLMNFILNYAVLSLLKFIGSDLGRIRCPLALELAFLICLLII
jgi:hypothetical protein